MDCLNCPTFKLLGYLANVLVYILAIASTNCPPPHHSIVNGETVLPLWNQVGPKYLSVSFCRVFRCPKIVILQKPEMLQEDYIFHSTLAHFSMENAMLKMLEITQCIYTTAICEAFKEIPTVTM